MRKQWIPGLSSPGKRRGFEASRLLLLLLLCSHILWRLWWPCILWRLLLYFYVFTIAARAQSLSGYIRLVDSFGFTGGSGGRVEIFINGVWGTICDDGFFGDEADVVCRQLGYNSASNYGNLGYGFGSSSQQIWLDDVNCPSSGTNVLLDCTYRAIGTHNCRHEEDAMVQCTGTLPTAVGGDNSGDLRLVQGSSTSSSFTAGRLEIFINGEWGTICDDGFGLAEGNVACQQLGFSRASETGINLGFGSGSSSQEIWLDNLNCDAFDSRIIDCSHSGIGVDNCLHAEDIMINCGDAIEPTIGPGTSTTNVAGIIVGCVVGATVLTIICVVAFVIGCVCCGVCAASSTNRSRRTAPLVTGYNANTATVTTSTVTAPQQQVKSSAPFAAPAQQTPPPANYYASQPVQGYGFDPNTNPKAEFSSSQAPPPYDAAMQYPPPQQQQQQQQQQPYYPEVQAYPPDQQQYPPPPNQPPYPTDQLHAAAPYPVAGDPAYPPAAAAAAGYPVQGYHPQHN